MNEGVIPRDVALVTGLSNEEIEKRERAQKQKKEKLLKSPNFFISTTRLAVRNLPKSVTDEELTRVFQQAAKTETEKVIIRQAKVLKETGEKRGKKKGGHPKPLGESKGIAFVEFAEHKHALTALRKINNNPEYFGDGKRPIVEFALENVQKVAQHKKKKKGN